MANQQPYIAIYRRFRPEVFSKLWGQETIIRILTNQLRAGSYSHAYLFSGTRGTGKTTVARLFAKGLNCLELENEKATEIPCGICENCKAIAKGAFIDVIEIDAASNNGVESIRDLRDSIKYPPAKGRKKVYIIDEVHMLSKGAFNALLKTLEEPPDHAIFLLATTEPGKVPQTIRSRCLKLDFRQLSAGELIEGMRGICTELDVKISNDALALVARGGDGSARDSLSLLEQVINGSEGGIDRKVALSILGMPEDKQLNDLVVYMFSKDVGGAIATLDVILAQGKDVRVIISELIDYFRCALLIKLVNNPEQIIGRSKENIATIATYTKDFHIDEINNGIYSLSKVYNEARWETQPRILLEMAIIEIAYKREETGK